MISDPPTAKGQAGGFLVLGAFLIVVFYILFSLGAESETRESTRPVSIWVSQVNYTIEGARDYVDACLNKSATYALLAFGRKGGIMDPNASSSTASKTPILLDTRGKETPGGKPGVGPLAFIPSKEAAQAILSQLIASGMEQCVDNLTIFRQRGFSITTGQGIATRVEVTPDGVEAFYTNQFTITKDKRKKTYQNFSRKTGTRLFDMMATAGTILTFQKNRPEDADLSMLKDSNLEIIFFSESGPSSGSSGDQSAAASVTVIRDPDHPLDGAPYEFWFATVRG